MPVKLNHYWSLIQGKDKEYRKFIDHIKKTGDSSMDHPASPL